jgi:hypothetical protein
MQIYTTIAKMPRLCKFKRKNANIKGKTLKCHDNANLKGKTLKCHDNANLKGKTLMVIDHGMSLSVLYDLTH